jgi:ribonuclease P protein component
MKKSLTKRERLHKRKDILHVLRSAQKIGRKGLTLLFKENDKTGNRVAFFLKKGFKKAVTRNRYKRVLRAIYREHKHGLKQGFDVLVILTAGEYTSAQLREYMLGLFERAHLLREKGEE